MKVRRNKPEFDDKGVKTIFWLGYKHVLKMFPWSYMWYGLEGGKPEGRETTEETNVLSKCKVRSNYTRAVIDEIWKERVNMTNKERNEIQTCLGVERVEEDRDNT